MQAVSELLGGQRATRLISADIYSPDDLPSRSRLKPGRSPGFLFDGLMRRPAWAWSLS